ncbi:dTMP kinase [Quadrisphaera setariae]|uniref:dTMP kinase n=1 Tax=Quadrisphaera setariae TaxID=2593304 RepID=UPI002105ABDC|nr:dTMP kinase [Quadrisphaera setariae]
MTSAAVPGGAAATAGTTTEDHGVRAVLRIRSFRQLWWCLGLSSLGDWLGLLATTALAVSLSGGARDAYAAANLAVAGVLVLRLAPAVVFGPLAGVVADRWDRKTTMVVGDVLRGLLFASIPLVGTLWWLLVATVLIEVVGLFWTPAKDATVPNIVPRPSLEAANQLTLVVTYGTAPVAALLFSGLSLLNPVLPSALDGVAVSLYLNAASYLVAALVVARLVLPSRRTDEDGTAPVPEGVGRSIVEGWRYVWSTPLVRGLVVGMLGAFAAGGFVIGVARTFVEDLDAGDPGYGVLFAAVFTGLALGMWSGPRVLAALPRWRLFALSLVTAGVVLFPLALVPNIVIVAALSLAVGACGGVAWVTGYTLLGLEVADEVRGRTFAFVQSSARIVLVGVLALAPALAALFGTHRIQVTDTAGVTYNGAALTLLVAAVLATGIGLAAYRTLDDGQSGPLRADLARAWRLRSTARPERRRSGPGFFISLEGGDGAGKSTQARLLAAWLRERGHEVVLTREPGATELGLGIRQLLLHGGHVSPRAEALLYAADRAHHVAELVRPALARGAVVVTDRYLDSSVAYQGAGRALEADEVASLSLWGTEDLLPDATVLLDLAPEAARARLGEQLDRLEREPEAFHEAVRERFRQLARRNRSRFHVVDAGAAAEEVAREVRERLEPLLPPPPHLDRRARPPAPEQDAEQHAGHGSEHRTERLDEQPVEQPRAVSPTGPGRDVDPADAWDAGR